MYVLRLLKESRIMERMVGSQILCMTVNKMFPRGTILPIVIGNYIVSEAKVVDSSILFSRIHIVLVDDSNIIPQFEVCDDLEINNIGRRIMDKTEIPIHEMDTSRTIYKDIRPCNISMLKLLIPDLLDYSGLKNLELNVRFKT